MVRYEVLTCQKGRWTARGILESQNAAVEHAQALAHRNYMIAAVRVMALEENADGFKEQVVYNRKVARASAATAGQAPAIGRPKPSAMRQVHSGMAARILVLLLFIACAALMGYGLIKPKQPWVFDTPDAQKPHLLRSPFAGDFS
jgi:hypothetical protein